MTYSWAAGFPNHGIDPQEVAERLESIRVKSGGTLDPLDIVREARAKKSLLHSFFEWDDTTAAVEYRIQQAKSIIRHVVMVVPDRPDSFVRAFVSVKQSEDVSRSYTSTIAAMESPELRAQVLRAARAELEAWRRRYRGLDEFAALFEVVDAELATTT